MPNSPSVADEDGFQRADVGQRSPAPPAEVDDRIPDELAGPVVGDLPSPIGPMDLHAVGQALLFGA